MNFFLDAVPDVWHDLSHETEKAGRNHGDSGNSSPAGLIVLEEGDQAGLRRSGEESRVKSSPTNDAESGSAPGMTTGSTIISTCKPQ
ncbi:MAG: hypothetical protein ABS79_02420 [Planctomycetes bacterium SCN 63-9]|nr:MAG: hypothetical protein ABS79_02420 [Planctomycetes bacterium SCN 63-9]